MSSRADSAASESRSEYVAPGSSEGRAAPTESVPADQGGGAVSGEGPMIAPPPSSAAKDVDYEAWRPTWESISPRDRARFLIPQQARKLVDALDRMKNANLSLNAESELVGLRALLDTLEGQSEPDAATARGRA